MSHSIRKNGTKTSSKTNSHLSGLLVFQVETTIVTLAHYGLNKIYIFLYFSLSHHEVEKCPKHTKSLTDWKQKRWKSVQVLNFRSTCTRSIRRNLKHGDDIAYRRDEDIGSLITIAGKSPVRVVNHTSLMRNLNTKVFVGKFEKTRKIDPDELRVN